MAVDTPAPIKVVLGGPLAEACGAVLERAEAAAVSAGALAEALIVAGRRGVAGPTDTRSSGSGSGSSRCR